MLDLWRWRFDFCFGGAAAFTSAAGFGAATGLRGGVATVVGPGVEISRCAGFTSLVGFGVVRFAGPTCEVGVGAVTGFFSSAGGVPFGGIGGPAGPFPLGDCLSTGEPGWVGFPPGSGSEAPDVPEGFTIGEAPGVPEVFPPSRFGGTDLFPAAALLG